MKRIPRVVILGRPNVGKSTLFNRLISRKRALVHDLPGVTRDRIEERTEWWIHGKPYPFLLVDTGGMGGERFAEEIAAQVRAALGHADIALLVLDAQSGLTPADEELLRSLQRQGVDQRIPILGIVNKIDAERHETLASEFYALGLSELITVSAEHGRGIDELKLRVFESLGLGDAGEVAGEPAEELAKEPPGGLEEKRRTPRVAIVGRPNVGKSTFVNAILGERRMITSPIAGTTVDAVDSIATLNEKPYVLIDTAGIRRKSKTEQGVEVLSVVQARKALERADVAVLLLDGEKGISEQDEKIGGLIEEIGCSVILAVNKWDTQMRNPAFSKEDAASRIRAKMAYLKYAPIVFVSAREGTGFQDLGDLIDEILHQRRLKVPTHEFTEWVRRESTVHNPQNAKFYLCHQSGRRPPTFVCHVNDADKIHFSLKRHLLNAMRERWGFMGTPVRLHFVTRQSIHSRSKPQKPSGGRRPAGRKLTM